MTLANNCLNLVIGFSNGDVKLFDLKTLKVVAIIEKAHQQKYDESVNCLACLESTGEEDPDRERLPFILSGGADNLVRVHEHNLYAIEKKESEQ